MKTSLNSDIKHVKNKGSESGLEAELKEFFDKCFYKGKEEKSFKEVKLPQKKDNSIKVKDADGMIEHVIKLSIYNVNGNSNELTCTPGDVSFSRGTVDDINEESVHRIISFLEDLSKESIQNLHQIVIPIYIFNIENVLTNGNKNTITTLQE